MRAALAASACAAALLAATMVGCSTGDPLDGQTPVVVDASEITPPPSVLDATTTEDAQQPAPPEPLVVAPTAAEGGATRPPDAAADATPRPDAGGAPTATELDEPTVEEVVIELGLDGFIEVLARNPDAAGMKGEDLLRELQRVADDPRESRIRRATRRTEEWLEKGELDEEVGRGALIVLALHEAQDGDPDDADNSADDDEDEDD